jgi:hypothetical protein
VTLRRIRKNVVRPSTVGTFATTFLLSIYLSACGDAALAPTATASEAAIATSPWAKDGRSMYRGMFFGEGGIHNDIPEMREVFAWRTTMDESQHQALATMVDDFVAAIDQANPRFFDEFAKVMRSGDHQRIVDVLNRAGDLTIAAADLVPDVAGWKEKLSNDPDAVQAEILRMQNAGELSEQSAEEVRGMLALMLASDTGSEAQAMAAGWWRGWAVAVALAVCVALAVPPLIGVVVAVAVAYAWAYGWSSISQAAELEKEEVVHAVATRLQPSGPIVAEPEPIGNQ